MQLCSDNKQTNKQANKQATTSVCDLCGIYLSLIFKCIYSNKCKGVKVIFKDNAE